MAFTSLAGGLAAAALALTVVVAHHHDLAAGGSPTLTVTAHVRGSGGRAELRLDGGHADLLVSGLRQPAAGHIYEVWLVHGANARPQPTTALFSVTSHGDGDVEVPGALASVTKVLVTEEPDGGTAVPTTAPVIEAQLS
jgi:hypothetical protein